MIPRQATFAVSSLLLLILSIPFFCHPVLAQQQKHKCDAVLTADLFDLNLNVDKQVNRSAVHRAMCSINAGEVSKYFLQQDREARAYCSLSEQEASDKWSGGVKVGGIAKFVTDVSGNFSREKFRRWKNQQCSSFERQGLLTTNDYNSWYIKNCSSTDKDDYNSSFRFELYKISAVREKIRAWEQCMAGDRFSTTLSCWFAPGSDEKHARFVFNWWTFPTKAATVKRFELLGGDPVKPTKWPFPSQQALTGDAGQPQLAAGQGSFSIARKVDAKDRVMPLRVNLSVEYGGANHNCSDRLPAPSAVPQPPPPSRTSGTGGRWPDIPLPKKFPKIELPKCTPIDGCIDPRLFRLNRADLNFAPK